MKTLNLSNVKPRPRLVDRHVWRTLSSATALYPNVYVSRTIYDDLRSTSPKPRNIALIAHEQEHIRRAKEYGVRGWYIRYIFSRTFRFEEELAATVVQFRLLKEHGINPSLEWRARSLSGVVYLWSTNYKTALARLREAWWNT